MKNNEDLRRGLLTLSKRPHSQISCSRALVLMAIVNRICGTKSCETGQTMKKSIFSLHQQPGVKSGVLEVLVAELYVALQGSQPNYLS